MIKTIYKRYFGKRVRGGYQLWIESEVNGRITRSPFTIGGTYLRESVESLQRMVTNDPSWFGNIPFQS